MTEQDRHEVSPLDSSELGHSPQPNRLKAILIAAAGLFLVVAAFVFFQGQHETGSAPEVAKATAPSGAQPATHLVQVTKPQRRDVSRTLTLPANISPWYQATLYGKVSGFLKWIGFDKGDTVKKGQLLALIDAPEILDQAQQAEAEYAIKKLTYERLFGVWKENPDVIAKQDVDVAEAEAEGAKQLMERRRTFLEYTRVTAPFAGTITARFADPGTLIQAATGSSTQANPLFTMMDIDTVRIYVSVPQESSALAMPGIPATLSVKELPGQEIKGSITRTTGALDPSTRTLLVEIDLPNKSHRLQPGMFINATLYLERHQNALILPPAAITPGSNGNTKSVFVVENGKVRRVPIKTGIDDGLWVEVIEGLTGSEDVVIVGKSNLQDGQAVTASAYDLPAGKSASQKY
ncbi:MAG: efflux RND transporter periplasmic adaptor subunit [Nitrospirota bacterium]|nr:efflux RND transporter periplasmic adaptor subunit [Nitrospirota bacterium]